MSDKNLTLTITESYERELLCSIFGEESMFNLQYDIDEDAENIEDEETEYELEVIVRRIGKKKT